MCFYTHIYKWLFISWIIVSYLMKEKTKEGHKFYVFSVICLVFLSSNFRKYVKWYNKIKRISWWINMSVFLCNSKANKCHRPFKKTPTGWHLLVFLSWSSEVRTKCRMNEAECSDRNRLLKATKKSPIQTKQERWTTEPKTQEHTGIQKDKHQEPKVNRAARERTWKHNLTKRNTQVKTSRARLTVTKEGETVRIHTRKQTFSGNRKYKYWTQSQEDSENRAKERSHWGRNRQETIESEDSNTQK